MQRIYRSRTDKILGGVAAGMAEYLSQDVALVRLIWLLFIFMGVGFPVYIVAWIIIPEEPYPGAAKYSSLKYGHQGSGTPGAAENGSETGLEGNGVIEGETFGDPSLDRTNQALGVLLVVIGLAFLIRETISWDIFRFVWPAIFIFLGVYILWNTKRG